GFRRSPDAIPGYDRAGAYPPCVRPPLLVLALKYRRSVSDPLACSHRELFHVRNISCKEGLRLSYLWFDSQTAACLPWSQLTRKWRLNQRTGTHLPSQD